MEVREHQPILPLRPYIACIKVIESRDGMTNRVLPGLSLALAFCYKGEISYLTRLSQQLLPPAVLTGLISSARVIHYAPSSAAVIILFKEGCASAFLDRPLHEIYGESISLASVYPAHEIVTLTDQIASANNDLCRVSMVEKFLLSKLISNNKKDVLVDDALSRIHGSNGEVNISQLRQSLFISKDAFEKRFRRRIGASPKQFSQIVKMNSIVRMPLRRKKLLDVVYEYGFYDQPHFNHEFKAFTGLTPTSFFSLEKFW